MSESDIYRNVSLTSIFANVWSHSTNVSNFHPLDVMGRGSDAQLQVGEHINKII